MISHIDRRGFLIVSGATATLAAVATGPLQAKTARVQIVGLKVDHLDCPLGLESRQPSFSWRLQSHMRNVRQSAYRVLVASDAQILKAGRGDLWDSSRIDSRKSFGIRYQGRELASRQRCWWCVQVWDQQGQASTPSAASCWEMGLLEPSDWTAQWLAVEDPIAKADREVGLHWVWGPDPNETGLRKFRFKFHLNRPSSGGEFFAVCKSPHFNKITGIWLDGRSVPMPVSSILSGQKFTLESMSEGEHLIALELDTGTPPAEMVEFANRIGFQMSGVAIFARLTLHNNEIVRIGSKSNGKTSLVPNGAWHTPQYDDRLWESTQDSGVKENQFWPPLPAMQLRTGFSVDRQPVKARLYITALGAYEARLNSRRVGDALLTPEISQYAKRVLYQVYDVTQLLQIGKNALGLTVADGWYGSFEGRYAWGLPPRRVLAQLEMTFQDGSRQIVSTGPGWRIAESPIQEAQIRVGEVYDARLEQPGWDSAAFDDSQWWEAQLADAPSCRKVAQVHPPIRIKQILKPRSILQPKPGVWVLDFGQNFAGWCRLRVKGSAGERIELEFAELLTSSGEIDPSSTGVIMGFKEPKGDVFILKGGQEEILEPHFTYRGFRYVQVLGLKSPPTVDSVDGVVFHTDLQITGRVRSDVPLIERLWQSILWTQRTNIMAIPTDNAHRERHGWMADAGIFWDYAAFNMDVSAFTARQMDNVRDDQAEDGAFPMSAPAPRSSIAFVVNGSPPAWGDGAIILPWIAWQRYGDTAVIERNWEAMNRYVQYIYDANPDYLWRHRRSADFGDWLSVGYDPKSASTSKDLIASAYWAHSTDLLGQMSSAIDRATDAQRLQKLFDRIRQAFNQAFVQSDGTVGNGSQTSQVLALKFGLLPENLKPAAAQRLADDIRSRGVALTTGILGTQFLLDVLADNGLADLAYGLLLRTELPSWGHMLKSGATAIWETWDGKTLGHNQPALGSVCGFLFRRMAGIDAATPGFETIIIRPVLDARVKRGGADYDSIMGRISTDWAQKENGQFTLNVTVPPNTTARVHLPARRSDRIWEGPNEIGRRGDVHVRQRSDREAVIEVASGIYRFVVTA